MIGELATEIDRIVGTRAHAYVTEEALWQRFHMRFHATPEYVVSANVDPMLKLRALAALPPGAALVAADRDPRGTQRRR